MLKCILHSSASTKETVTVYDSSLEAKPSLIVLSILLPLHLKQELHESFIMGFLGNHQSQVLTTFGSECPP